VLTLRSTILGPDPNNQSEPFRCSAFNVPYSTAVYTNADGAGGGFMGPYVPLASYPTVSSLVSPSQPIGPSSLPSEASCAALSASSPSPFPSGNLASISQPSQWPVQLWGDTAEAPPYLNCGGGSSTFQPAIYYAGSQFTIEAVAANQPGYVAPPNFNTQSPCDYLDTYTPPNGNNAGTNSNPCMQVIQQVTENESTTTYQPPLPLTIVGTGFGYLSGLPRVVSPATSPQYIDAQEWTYPGPPSGQELWDSNSNSTGNCQVYITDWNDTGISLLLGLPPAAGAGGITNGEQQYLNPLTVMSPMSFFPKTSNVACPVTYGSVSQPNYLYVKVTNPQSNTAGAYVAVPIYSLGTACTLPNTNPGCPY
jgi:hypothetical protein